MLLGVTGNIGAGKSTFCAFLKSFGLPVYSADDIGKELLKKNAPAHGPVVEAFGKQILRPDGEISTKKLADLVFREPEKLKLLTSITHPLILERIAQIGSKHPLAVVEAAVMVEYGWQEHFDKVAVVFAYRGQRILRAARKFGIAEALRRDSLQLPYGEKLKYAHYLICNTDSPLHLKEQAEKLAKELEVL